MHDKNKTILVFGATGKQGNAVAENLLNNGWRVRAITRKPNQPAANDLEAKGAKVVQADMNNKQSLVDAMKGVYGVYSVQPLYFEKPDDEIQHGKRVADAAKEEGVKHFVYSSVEGADRNSRIPHFETKWEIEKYIHSIDLPFTILRPVFFMENFTWLTSKENQTLIVPKIIDEDIKLQMISVQDIGSFASIVFNTSDKFKGSVLKLAGDELKLSQVANVLSQVCDVPSKVSEKEGNKFQGNKMFKWFETDGYQANIPLLREIHPNLFDFYKWAKNTNENTFFYDDLKNQ